MSGFGISTRVEVPFDDAVARTRAALAEEGFGVLTEIDVAATLRAKLGVDVPPQVVLGACNPSLAYRGLQLEPDLGLLLPCNVVLRALPEGGTLVSTLEPAVMVGVAGRATLEPVAAEARTRLRAALERVAGDRPAAAS